MATSPNYGWLEPDNTDLVKNGALAIRTLGNAIDTTMATMTPKSIVDAKGDLIAASAADTPARLAVGNNGETLVADSSTSTGLRYQGNFAAGKNKIINGDFNIWQRGTSFTAAGNYTADRYYAIWDGTGTKTISQQTFTPGTAPVSGYESQYYLRFNQTVAGTGSNYNVLTQRIEDVRTLAGQTVTVSFWAKSASTTAFAATLVQNFGSGGSGNVTTSFIPSTATTTGWVRYTGTAALPSISGKTIGSSSFVELTIILPINAAFTLDFWGVQVEASNTATAFQTATGTIQGELAACQRYYQRVTSGGAYATISYTGSGNSPTFAYVFFPLKTSLRVSPTSVDFSAVALDDGVNSVIAITNVDSRSSSPDVARLGATVASGLTTYRPYYISSNNNAAGYVGVSAEL